MRNKDSIIAKAEYDKLTFEEIIELGFTGDWVKDRKVFTMEWRNTQDILNDKDWDVFTNEDDDLI